MCGSPVIGRLRLMRVATGSVLVILVDGSTPGIGVETGMSLGDGLKIATGLSIAAG